MPYSIDWYIESEIIYIHYSGATTVDELRESLIATKNMIDSSDRHLVHMIADVGDVTEATSIKDSLQVVREVGAHDRTGWQITLREKSIVVKMGAAFGTTLFKIRARTFDTMDETVAFLKTQDETLSWNKINTSLRIP